MIKLAMIMQLWFNPKESFEACWKDPGTKPRKQKIKNESIIGKNKKLDQPICKPACKEKVPLWKTRCQPQIYTVNPSQLKICHVPLYHSCQTPVRSSVLA
jgi:hypothetical protein